MTSPKSDPRPTEAPSPEKHTPGPWVVDEFWPNGGIWKIRGADSALCHVHSFHLDDGDKPTPESEADARLIAAAPELLAALIALVNHPGPCPKSHKGCAKGRAAIAKAEGRQ